MMRMVNLENLDARSSKRPIPYFYVVNLGHRDYRDECKRLTHGNTLKLRVSHLPLRASTMASVGVAQAFGIDDPETLRRAVAASLCLDHFAHAMDDASDFRHATPAIDHVHAGSLLLARAIRRYSAMRVSGRFWEAWQGYMDEASAAERALLSRRGCIEGYTSDDLALLGRKSALAKTNAALFADISGEWERLDAVEQALECAAIGIQLIDDAFDWREDYCAQDYTYPLSLLFEVSDYRHIEDVSEAFDEGDVLDRVASLSVQYMRDAESRFAALGAFWLASLSAAVSDGLEEYLNDVAALGGRTRKQRQTRLRNCIRPQVTH